MGFRLYSNVEFEVVGCVSVKPKMRCETLVSTGVQAVFDALAISFIVELLGQVSHPKTLNRPLTKTLTLLKVLGLSVPGFRETKLPKTQP